MQKQNLKIQNPKLKNSKVQTLIPTNMYVCQLPAGKGERQRSQSVKTNCGVDAIGILLFYTSPSPSFLWCFLP